MAQSPSKPPAQAFVICDSNVIIMMAIFKPSVMFSSKYSFGEVEVHFSVISEMERWIERGGAKLSKFGKPLIEDAIKYSKSHTGRIKELGAEERKKSHRILAGMEASVYLRDPFFFLPKLFVPWTEMRVSTAHHGFPGWMEYRFTGNPAIILFLPKTLAELIHPPELKIDQPRFPSATSN